MLWYHILISYLTSYFDITFWSHILISYHDISYHDISYHDIISCYIISQHDISCLNITYHVLRCYKMSRKSTKCQKMSTKYNKFWKMLKNGFDRFKSDHFGFVLYKNTLRIHFWCILEAKIMVTGYIAMFNDFWQKGRTSISTRRIDAEFYD